jgi:hypothetical protein
LAAAASAKQKLSTRFQPQRKPTHRLVQANSVKRAKTFSLGGGGHLLVQPAAAATGYKTLPKQASSRSLGSTSSSTDSSQGSQSTASSRKSSDSSNLSDSGSSAATSPPDISPEAMHEIAAFEKFIEKYFQNCENNNNNNNNNIRHNNNHGRLVQKGGKLPPGRIKPKVSAGSSLAEVLELSI